MNQILPGITKVGYISLANLPHDVVNKVDAGIDVIVTGSYITYMDIVGSSSCQNDEKFDNNSSYEKAKLNFTATELVLKYPQKAFIIQTVEDKWYVIGADNQAPVMEVKSNTGVPSGDAAKYDYEVSFTARKALIPCTIS